MKQTKVFSLIPRDELERLRDKVTEKTPASDVLTRPDPLMSATEKSIRSTDDELRSIEDDQTLTLLDKLVKHANAMKRYQIDSKRALGKRGHSGVDYSRSLFASRDPDDMTDSTKMSNEVRNLATEKLSHLESNEKDFLNKMFASGMKVDVNTGRISVDGRQLSADASHKLLTDAVNPQQKAALHSTNTTWNKFKKDLTRSGVVIPRLATTISKRGQKSDALHKSQKGTGYSSLFGQKHLTTGKWQVL